MKLTFFIVQSSSLMLLPIRNNIWVVKELIKFMEIKGIHHISSIVGDAQRDLDFYSSTLGLRLVKQTLNYEDKYHYHLYYGNEKGSNGIVTTFPMNNKVEGRIGDGQVGYISYGINPESFEFWKDRFDFFDIEYYEYSRFGLKRLQFSDPDGLMIEFIETKELIKNLWSTNEVKSENSFKGIHSAALYSKNTNATVDLLKNIFGYKLVDEDNEYYQLRIHSDITGLLEISKESKGYGQIAIGTVHHIALGVKNDEIDLWRNLLIKEGYHPTEVKDRHYFRSLYFRDKGGILFELATEGPGLLIDESLEDLGKEFIIPEHFINDREEIMDSITILKTNKL